MSLSNCVGLPGIPFIISIFPLKHLALIMLPLLAVMSVAAQRTDSASLQEVEVRAKKKLDIATNAHAELKGLQLFQVSGQTLGESLKGVPGLNSIQTGPSISKPVIHGLHSNRVLILNNGVRQEGQQWG